ncbi:MAG: hypothetical protein KatS3mg102_2979 [Planctomycetota bacterium]|nr:MAG: hypothetical protein KatS3mg102_2979 [Planctomycetota bacterium]
MVLELLGLLGLGFVGSVFWVVSTEAAAVYYGSALACPPLLVGLACALGQCGMYLILYAGGEQLLGRWRWLGRQVDRARQRLGERLETAYLSTAGLGAVLGVPPALAFPALAGSFGVRLGALLPVMFAGRLVRFSVLAAAGAQLLGWLRF